MQNTKILIVEDEFIIAHDIKNMLQNLNYTVTGIKLSGEECIEEIKENKPDIVLMDIKLKGELDGIETAKKILKNYDIPIIFLTAHSDKSSLHKAALTNPYGYLIKPIRDKELFIAVETSRFRYKAEKKLKENERKYRNLFEQSRDAIFLINMDWEITNVNKSMVDTFEFNKRELYSMHMNSFFLHSKDFKEVIKKLDNDGYIENFETILKKKDSTPVVSLITINEFYNDLDGERGYQVIIRDITEMVKTIGELIKSKEDVNDMSNHLQNIRETERADLAREIHDVLGQSLTALKLDFIRIIDNLNNKTLDFQEKSDLFLKNIDNIIDSVGMITSELRPVILEDLGLCAAIKWLAKEFKKRSGIKCTTIFDPAEILIEQKKSLILFRILQEALTNIIRHASATEVEVDLMRRNGSVNLIIKDNGRGIGHDEINGNKSFGIMGIKERAFSCEGKVNFKGSKNNGTTISVSVPL